MPSSTVMVARRGEGRQQVVQTNYPEAGQLELGLIGGGSLVISSGSRVIGGGSLAIGGGWLVIGGGSLVIGY